MPAKWLGKPFLEEAEFLKETNLDAYERMSIWALLTVQAVRYLIIVIRQMIADEEITFDHAASNWR